ncbi:MAG: hypothetical protein KC621_09715 [Myxococcales bacterium]|nr:hypothetical protein [Myxococcales bacterium]
MLALAAVVANAQDAPELGVLWGIEVDGVPVGTRELKVRYEGTTGERTRFVEGWTELTLPALEKTARAKARAASTLRQRLTANSQDGRPASFVSVTETDGAATEVQAHVADGLWQIAWTDGAGTRRDQIPVRGVDLSTVDLFDPESERRLAQFVQVRILDDATGKVEDGAVVALGPSDVRLGGEDLWVETFEWLSPHGSWRFYYATNGFLVRWEAPLEGRRVVATLIGPAPRGVDEFVVPGLPTVEVSDLP